MLVINCEYLSSMFIWIKLSKTELKDIVAFFNLEKLTQLNTKEVESDSAVKFNRPDKIKMI